MDVWARCVRGIEWIAAAELDSRGARVLGVGHRDVFASADASVALACGTVDDVFEVIAEVDGIGRERASLERLTDGVSFRTHEPFEVVGSFLGRRNFNRFDVEDGVGRAIGRGYVSRRDDAVPDVRLSLRVHIANGRAVVGRRLSPYPLHRRTWRESTRPGSLHPPVAFAIGMLAGVDGLVLDPLCGAGTVAIESALATSATCLAFDLRAGPATDARDNAGRAGVAVHAAIADAGVLPLPAQSVDAIVGNLPWGVRVPALDEKSLAALFAEIRRVLHADGRAVLLMHDDATPDVLDATRLSVSGEWADLVVLGRPGVPRFGPLFFEVLERAAAAWPRETRAQNVHHPRA